MYFRIMSSSIGKSIGPSTLTNFFSSKGTADLEKRGARLARKTLMTSRSIVVVIASSVNLYVNPVAYRHIHNNHSI
jgi:hypothetical protein